MSEEASTIESIFADEIWFEEVHPGSAASSLLVAFDLRANKLQNAAAGEPFDAIIDGPGGEPIGVASFQFIGRLGGRAIFEAIRLCPVDTSSQPPAPPRSRLLMRRLVEI